MSVSKSGGEESVERAGDSPTSQGLRTFTSYNDLPNDSADNRLDYIFLVCPWRERERERER